MEDEAYKLFIETHYIVREKVSYVPSWSKGAIHFQKHYIMVRRKLSLLDKLKYYIRDFKIWLRERKYESNS